MVDKPVTREEKYLAYLTGDYKGRTPEANHEKREVFIRIMFERNGRGDFAGRNQSRSK